MKPSPPPRIRSDRDGFSLVEIALAVGIVAFAFVGLMGLLPVGLAHFRTAIDASVGSQIFQRVVTDLEQMEFDTLLALGDTAPESKGDFFVLKPRYFDDQGAEVAPAGGGNLSDEEELRVIYRVRVRISRPGPAAISSNASGITSLPAAGQDRFTFRDSVFATIQVVHQPGKIALPVDGHLLWDVPKLREQNLALSTYSAVITRNGYKKRP